MFHGNEKEKKLRSNYLSRKKENYMRFLKMRLT